MGRKHCAKVWKTGKIRSQDMLDKRAKGRARELDGDRKGQTGLVEGSDGIGQGGGRGRTGPDGVGRSRTGSDGVGRV